MKTQISRVSFDKNSLFAIDKKWLDVHFNLIFQVIEIKDSVPAESYRVFMDVLLDTIRNEIGMSKQLIQYFFNLQFLFHTFLTNKFGIRKNGFIPQASCMEKSYDDIGKADCADMLNLNPSKLDNFIKVKIKLRVQ